MLSLEAPRHHHDIDLFYPAGGFEALDVCLASLQEVKLKRFPHKRAFLRTCLWRSYSCDLEATAGMSPPTSIGTT